MIPSPEVGLMREIEWLKAENERLRAKPSILYDGPTQLTIAGLKAEIERLTKERDFARDAVAQKCRQYDEDMQTMQAALNREIEARRALEGKK